jgi:regulatory protein
MNQEIVTAKELALRYLSRFARTELQLRRYLQRKGYSSSDISDAVSYLHEHRFLNDHSYAESYITSRIRRLDGPMKIKLLLLQKGIDASTAQKLLQQLYPLESQIDNARKLAAKRSRTKEQLRRFIASRGYSGYVIMRALR